jgi:hypothetical protein
VNDGESKNLQRELFDVCMANDPLWGVFAMLSGLSLVGLGSFTMQTSISSIICRRRTNNGNMLVTTGMWKYPSLTIRRPVPYVSPVLFGGYRALCGKQATIHTVAVRTLIGREKTRFLPPLAELGKNFIQYKVRGRKRDTFPREKLSSQGPREKCAFHFYPARHVLKGEPA